MHSLPRRDGADAPPAGSIVKREATAEDLAKLEQLCEMVARTSLCGLGQNAPNPVLSTLRFFRSEYLELLRPESNGGPGRPCMPLPRQKDGDYVIPMAAKTLTIDASMSARRTTPPSWKLHPMPAS